MSKGNATSIPVASLLVLGALGLVNNLIVGPLRPRTPVEKQVIRARATPSLSPREQQHQRQQRLEQENDPVKRQLLEIALTPEPTGAQTEKIGLLFRQALAADPADPPRLLAPFLGGASEYAAKLALASVWAENGVRPVFAWIALEQAPDIKQSLYEAAGGALGARAPQEAIQLAARLEPGWARKEYLKSVTTGWMSRDFSGAMAWADALPDGDERNESLIPLVMNLASRTPRHAMAYAVERIPAGPFQEQMLANVFVPWVQQEPAAAKEWIADLPAGDLKADLTDKVRQHEEWLGSQSDATSLSRPN
jgi:hypothetical protein